LSLTPKVKALSFISLRVTQVTQNKPMDALANGGARRAAMTLLPDRTNRDDGGFIVEHALLLATQEYPYVGAKNY
jgi:hypothetical protein